MSEPHSSFPDCLKIVNFQLSIGCSLCGGHIPSLCGPMCPLAGLFCGSSGLYYHHQTMTISISSLKSQSIPSLAAQDTSVLSSNQKPHVAEKWDPGRPPCCTNVKMYILLICIYGRINRHITILLMNRYRRTDKQFTLSKYYFKNKWNG